MTRTNRGNLCDGQAGELNRLSNASLPNVHSVLPSVRRAVVATAFNLAHEATRLSKKLTRFTTLIVIATCAVVQASGQVPTLPMSDDNFLRLPVVGDHSLRLLNSNVVEVMMVTAKDADPAPLTSWNFISATGTGSLPAASSFTVTVNGSSVPVTAVGFKRRVLYAPLRVRDLRLANWLYLQLGTALPANAVVSVQNPAGDLWSSSVLFIATNSPLRYSPAIHVNQAGYIAGTIGGNNAAKKAMIGQYLGTLGEMAIPTNGGFQLVNAQSGVTVFSGALTRRPDVGYSYTPAPYQQVFEADFSSFNTPGEYKLVVPGVGASFPFYIDGGMAGTYARTYALGLYHNRCGTDNVQPYTRHTHAACHTNLVMVPYAAGPEQTFVNYVLNNESASAANNPRHTAPRMTNVNASLYPFINTASFDARGGHHDAGDYSKYTTSVSAFVHYLTFAVDALPGVKDLDNLGIPESGDGVSDILQKAKWEADYLAKLQDADGGFYFIVYPRTRQYELDSLPEQGDAQLVLPKNTAATAAAVAALAEIASSPTFKATYPTVASNYLAKAIKGWQFLQTAIATHGRDGAYQMITFSGDTFMHDDELAWAAAALYVATGDPAYNTALRAYMPNPNSQSLRRWAWWSMFGGWGNATRTYAFAARSGRLNSAQMDPSYLALCEAEIKFAGSNAVDWSAKMAYGSSFTDESKGLRVAGWYFSGEWTMDPAVAWVVDSSSTTKALYLDTILKNYNYEMGCNPVNVTYLTGLGTKRQREIVHQYALNDRRVLPPGGIPLGNIQAQYDYLQLYKTELSSVSYPLDDSPSQPYAYYDRWADTFNVSTEFVISQTAKTIPAAAMLMAMSPVKTQTWNSATAQIVNLPASTNSSQPVTAGLTSAVDLSKARIVWESGNNIARQEPFLGTNYTFIPGTAGPQWVEAEAQLPDGRRMVAVANFNAVVQPTNTIELYQTIALAQNTNVVAWYTFDNTYADAKGIQAAFVPAGNAVIDNGSFAWAGRPNGAAVRFYDLTDTLTVSIPNSALANAATTDALSIEAMMYVNRQVAYGRGNADLFVLSKGWNAEFALRHNIWTAGPAISGGATSLVDYATLGNYLKTGQWQHLKIRLSKTNYTVAIDGQTIASVASTDLANWGGSGNATFKIGGWDGWIDEVVVKNEGAGSGTVVTNPPASGLPTVTVTATDANAAESGADTGTFTVTRSAGTTTNLVVQLAVGGTATSGVDCTALPATLTILAGSTTATLTVSPLSDTSTEGSESLTVSLTAAANYTVGTPGSATVTIADAQNSPPPTPTGTNYLAYPTVLDTNVVALYHLDGNGNDASGRYSALTPVGNAAYQNSNLGWMNSPAGAALRVNDLGDSVSTTLNNANLFTSGLTEAVSIEALVYIDAYKGYGVKSATLLSMSKRWDAQMILSQDTWGTSAEVWGGTQRIVDSATLAQYLKTKCWQKITLLLDTNGYAVKVNDVEIARVASTDLATKWGGAGNVTVNAGNFDGWLDEIVVRSKVAGYDSVPRTFAPPSIASLNRATNGMRLSWTATAGSQFQVQWRPSASAGTWTTFTNLITSTNGSYTFLDNGTQTGGLASMRFYRLLQLQ